MFKKKPPATTKASSSASASQSDQVTSHASSAASTAHKVHGTSVVGLIGDLGTLYFTGDAILNPTFFSKEKKDSLRHRLGELHATLEALNKTASEEEKSGLSLLLRFVAQTNAALGLLEDMTPSKLMGLYSAQLLARPYPIVAGALNRLLGNWSGESIEDLIKNLIAQFNPLLTEILAFLKTAGTEQRILDYVSGEFLKKDATASATLRQTATAEEAEILAKIDAFEAAEKMNVPIRMQAMKMKTPPIIEQAAKAAHEAVMKEITALTTRLTKENSDKKAPHYKEIKKLCAQLLAKAKNLSEEKIRKQLKSHASKVSHTVKNALFHSVMANSDHKPATPNDVITIIKKAIEADIHPLLHDALKIDQKDFSKNEPVAAIQREFEVTERDGIGTTTPLTELSKIEKICVAAAAESLASVFKNDDSHSTDPKASELGSGFVRLGIALTQTPLPYRQLFKQLFPSTTRHNAAAWVAVGNSLHGIITLLQTVIPNDLTLTDPTQYLNAQTVLSPSVTKTALSAISHMSTEDKKKMIARAQMPLHIMLFGMQFFSKIYDESRMVSSLFMNAEANASEEKKAKLAQLLNQSDNEQENMARAMIEEKKQAEKAVVTQATHHLFTAEAMLLPQSENDQEFAQIKEMQQFLRTFFYKTISDLKETLNELDDAAQAVIKNHQLYYVPTTVTPDQPVVPVGIASAALLKILATLHNEMEFLLKWSPDQNDPILQSFMWFLKERMQDIYYRLLPGSLAYENAAYHAISQHTAPLPDLLLAITEEKELEHVLSKMRSTLVLMPDLNEPVQAKTTNLIEVRWVDYVNQNLRPALKQAISARKQPVVTDHESTIPPAPLLNKSTAEEIVWYGNETSQKKRSLSSTDHSTNNSSLPSPTNHSPEMHGAEGPASFVSESRLRADSDSSSRSLFEGPIDNGDTKYPDDTTSVDELTYDTDSLPAANAVTDAVLAISSITPEERTSTVEADTLNNAVAVAETTAPAADIIQDHEPATNGDAVPVSNTLQHAESDLPLHATDVTADTNADDKTTPADAWTHSHTDIISAVHAVTDTVQLAPRIDIRPAISETLPQKSSHPTRNRWLFGLTAFATTAAAFGAGYALPSVGAAIGLGLVGVGLSAATGGIFAGAVALIMLAVFVGLYCSGVFSKKPALPPVKPFLPLTQNTFDSSAIGGPSPAVTPALTAAASNTAAPTAADPKETNARKHSLTSENSGESSLPLSRL